MPVVLSWKLQLDYVSPSGEIILIFFVRFILKLWFFSFDYLLFCNRWTSCYTFFYETLNKGDSLIIYSSLLSKYIFCASFSTFCIIISELILSFTLELDFTMETTFSPAWSFIFSAILSIEGTEFYAIFFLWISGFISLLLL